MPQYDYNRINQYRQIVTYCTIFQYYNQVKTKIKFYYLHNLQITRLLKQPTTYLKKEYSKLHINEWEQSAGSAKVSTKFFKTRPLEKSQKNSVH